MRRIQQSIFALFIIVCATTARAEQPTGVELGARIAYGFPIGEELEGSDLSQSVAGQIPLIFDLGYRAMPALFVGGFFQYGFGLIGDHPDANVCDIDGVDCSVSDIRVGVQLHVHILPNQPIDPWVGIGSGYEWLNIDIDAPGVGASGTTHGLEFLNLQAGFASEAGSEARAGVFLSFSLGQYSEGSVELCESGSCMTAEGEIPNQTLHHWLLLGASGTFLL